MGPQTYRTEVPFADFRACQRDRGIYNVLAGPCHFRVNFSNSQVSVEFEGMQFVLPNLVGKVSASARFSCPNATLDVCVRDHWPTVTVIFEVTIVPNFTATGKEARVKNMLLDNHEFAVPTSAVWQIEEYVRATSYLKDDGIYQDPTLLLLS